MPIKWNRGKAGIAIVIYDQTNLKSKIVRKDKEVYFTLIKWKNPPKGYYSHIHICTRHRGTQFHEKTLLDLKLHIGTNSVLVHDFNNSLSANKLEKCIFFCICLGIFSRHLHSSQQLRNISQSSPHIRT